MKVWYVEDRGMAAGNRNPHLNRAKITLWYTSFYVVYNLLAVQECMYPCINIRTDMRSPICPGQNQPQGVSLRPQGSPTLIEEMVRRRRRSKWVTDYNLSLAAVTNSHLRDICYRPFLFIFMMFHKVLVGVTRFNSLTVLNTTDTSPFQGKLIPPTVIYFQKNATRLNWTKMNATYQAKDCSRWY